MLRIIALVAALVAVAPAAAQQTAPAAQPEAVRVFLDCNGFHCDQDFYRTEINWVGYVRDRQDADVHVLITRQQTGSGGGEHTLEFIGLRRFQGVSQTLRFTSGPSQTEDEVRRGLAEIIKLGLVRYAADSPAGARLRVTIPGAAESAPKAAEGRDPWDHWTFRAGVRGYFNGESSYTSRDLNGSLSANRVTAGWKTRLSLNANSSRSEYELTDTSTFVSSQETYSSSALVVRSLGAHWSAGAKASALRSTYSNYDRLVRAGPAVEYNVFPYSESTRRQLTLQYAVSGISAAYDERTRFGKLDETRVEHSLTTSLDLKQPWGSIGVSAEAAHLLDDAARNRLVLFGNADVRLFKGLSLNFFASGSRVRDQLNIRDRTGTPEEILTREIEQLTAFRYFASVGLSYTFGSIYNSVVNPRFGGSSGGVVFIN
ncbi:MAG TPA: hypothetical protein VF647_03840 [Longimicrobium sp.]|jgi:hypothetical protein